MLREYSIFIVVQRLVDKNIAGSKWVYILKWLEDRGLDKKKAQTVVKSFTQFLEEDFNKIYIL